MQVTFDHVQQEAKNIATFYFKPERPLRYVAGQFIELTLPHDNPDDRGVKRWFTLSSAPGRELVSITTKHANTSSTFKQHLWKLRPGDTVDMSEPMGDFVLPVNKTTPLVFVAGGIGITPFRAIVQWLADVEQSRPIQLLYRVHNRDELVFSDEFTTGFITKHELTGGPKLTAAGIVELAGGIDGKQVFISGPEPMTEAIVAQFKQDFGLDQSQLVTDYFPGYTA